MMKHIYIFVTLLLGIPTNTFARYHGKRTLSHAPYNRTITVSNNSATQIIIYFKPFVDSNDDVATQPRCTTTHCTYQSSYQKKRTRLGYTIAPHSTKMIDLANETLQTVDSVEGSIDNRHLTYGRIMYRAQNGCWIKSKYITLYDNAHYHITIVDNHVTVSRT